MSGASALRVVVIDDSATTRRWIRNVLETAGISVVGEAADGRAGRDIIVQQQPDVITLDLDMPGVDGLTLLRAIQKAAPRPVVVLSGKVALGSAAGVAALQAGATHVLPKPGPRHAAAFASELVHRVRQAAESVVRFDGDVSGRSTVGVDARFAPGQLIAIGSSTGGPSALREVLAGLPAHAPPVVIAQHLPPDQPSSLGERLGSTLRRDVAQAREGERLAEGMVRIAPPDRHLTIIGDGADYVTRIVGSAPNVAPGTPRPSVDVLFHSVAAVAARRAVGVILTGMGDDGAEGLAQLRSLGAHTIAQDEATSVVFGMPRAAISRGAAATVTSLRSIPAAIVRVLKRVADPSRAA